LGDVCDQKQNNRPQASVIFSQRIESAILYQDLKKSLHAIELPYSYERKIQLIVSRYRDATSDMHTGIKVSEKVFLIVYNLYL
jgi:hypothetical protein